MAANGRESSSRNGRIVFPPLDTGLAAFQTKEEKQCESPQRQTSTKPCSRKHRNMWRLGQKQADHLKLVAWFTMKNAEQVTLPYLPAHSLRHFRLFFRLGYRIKPHVCRFCLHLWFLSFFPAQQNWKLMWYIFFSTRERSGKLNNR